MADVRNARRRVLLVPSEEGSKDAATIGVSVGSRSYPPELSSPTEHSAGKHAR